MMKRSEFGNSKRGRFKTFVGLLLVIVAVWRLFCIGMDYREGEETYRKLEQAVSINSEIRKESVQAEDTADTQETQDRGQAEKAAFDFSSIEIDFSYLQSLNEDIIGWLLFDYNGISYPVLQGEDNREYLYTMADKTENHAGSIFMDSLCGPDFEDMHTILYGHNRKDLTMFGKLKKYGAQAGYYEKNRYFTIYTPKNIFRYEIFAWYEAAEDDKVYQVGFSADAAFEDFTTQMKKRSFQNTQVDVGRKDKIVTLSTCSAMGRRFVVHGKRIGGE